MQSLYFDDFLTFIIIGIICFVIPGTLTGYNIYNCVAKEPKKEKLMACLTIFIGGLDYIMLHALSYDEAGEWYETINSMQYHYSVSLKYGAIFIPVFLGFVGYFILLFVEAEKLPPLVTVLSICFLILLNVIHMAYAIQISKNVDDIEYIFYLYHLNLLILSARVIYVKMNEQVLVFRRRAAEMHDEVQIPKKYNIFWKLFAKIERISQYSIVIFIGLFFVVAIMEIIFVLLGQGLDAPIKAFTDTADWTFSKQTPPPPIEYDGHYLCTVAAGGHRKIVRPLRLGTRGNHTIVVNRQLCIANAFEEVIGERFPRFHKRIRYAYDTYGYPLSKKITSPLRADFVYILMKPLEWGFLVFLYMFDLRPEKRIARQYAYKIKQIK